MFQLSHPYSCYGYKKGLSFLVSWLFLSPIKVFLNLSLSFMWLPDESSVFNLFSTRTTALHCGVLPLYNIITTLQGWHGLLLHKKCFGEVLTIFAESQKLAFTFNKWLKNSFKKSRSFLSIFKHFPITSWGLLLRFFWVFKQGYQCFTKPKTPDISWFFTKVPDHL